MSLDPTQAPAVSSILHYDPKVRDLRTWFWPVNDAGERVPPENLSDHRQTHNFQLPCCFCAVTTTAYTEMSIFVAIDGDFAGEYVAGCQNDRCGYLICIERLYTKVGLPLKRYSLRVNGGPAAMTHAPDLATAASDLTPAVSFRTRPRGIARNRRGVLSLRPRNRDVLQGILTQDPPPKAPETAFSKLLRLDSYSEPGLSEAEFQGLFARCRWCHWIMTRGAFVHHNCTAVIDLTQDDK